MIIEFALPEGYDTFQARGMLSRNRPTGGSVEFVVLTEAARIDTPTKSRGAVSLAELRITGEVTARDHWKREDLGAFRDTFGPRHH